MSEFKLKRGRKVYHIREFSSLLELARRGMIAPDDPIFVPSVERWVYARAIHELSALLEGTAPRGSDFSDAEELPLDFVEPLGGAGDGPAVQVAPGVLDLGIEVTWEETRATPSEAAGPGSGPGEPGGSALDGRSRRAAGDLFGTSNSGAPGNGSWDRTDVGAGLPRQRDARAAPAPGRDRLPTSFERDRDDFPGPDAGGPGGPRGLGEEDRPDGHGRAGHDRGRGRVAPVSFQDWMAQHARNGELEPADGGLLPLLTGLEHEGTDTGTTGVRWGRLVVITGVLAGVLATYFVYVKVIADLEFEPWEPGQSVPAPGPEGGSEPGTGATAVVATPTPELAAMDLRMRKAIPPNIGAFRSFEQAEDRLFSELLNLKIGVADVRLKPVDGNVYMPVRKTESDITVRLRHARLPIEEQTGIIGLVIGKYMSRERLKVRDLVLRIERPDQVPAVRIVPGRSAKAYFRGEITFRQFLLAVQAGTVTP